jgi:hypothetical protein
MKNVLIGGVAALLFCAFVYGSFWVGKKTSYYFFYEDFVKATVRAMVKQDALKRVSEAK